MRKKGMLYTAFLLILQQSPCPKELVWSPIMDQECQTLWDPALVSRVENPSNIPDYPLSQTVAQFQDTIAKSLDIVYKKGIRVIDMEFWVRESDLAPDITDPEAVGFFRACAHRGEYWIQAVNTYNASLSGDYLKLRIRVPAHRTALERFFSTSRFTPDERETRKNFLAAHPMYDNRTGAPTIPDCLLNFSYSEIRSYIQEYTVYIIDRVNSLITEPEKTVIQHVTLALDAGGESSLVGFNGSSTNANKNGWVNFTRTRYDELPDFHARVHYFEMRQHYLHLIYRDFDKAVASRGLQSAIFYENWAFDDEIRGVFDLYKALKGTGIDFLHTCLLPHQLWDASTPEGAPFPNALYPQHIRLVAFSALTANKLGIPFDVEFSAPFVYLINQDGWYSPIYDPSHLTTGNARSFYEQALAAFDYGADGVTYCHWPMYIFRHRPDQLRAVNSYGTPVEWRNILGADMMRYYLREDRWGQPSPTVVSSVEDFDASHIGGTGGWVDCPASTPSYTFSTIPFNLEAPSGLCTYSNTEQLPAARTAIFISTYGRMAATMHQNAGNRDYAIVPVRTYLEWFDTFGLANTVTEQKVDILTEGMLEDNPDLFADYTMVYFPFETSGVIGPQAYNRLINSSDEIKSKIRYQPSKGAPGWACGLFSDWMNSHPLIYVQPASLTAIINIVNE